MKSILLLLITSPLLHAGLVRALPLLPGDAASPDYEVRVDGKPVPVAFGEFNGGHSFHHAGFEIDGASAVTVRFLQGRPDSVELLPSRHALTLKEQDNSISFELGQPLKLVLKAEGLRPLFLFGLPPEVDPPKPGDANVHYFPAGVHEVGKLTPKSGETIYLEAGAVVKGILHAFEIENLVIRGRGLWDARGYTSRPKKIHGMLFERSKNIRLEGIQLRSGDWWQTNFLLSSDIEIEHVMTMSFGKNNDGIDLDGVTNLTARHCFIGCGDDGFGWHAVDAVTLGEPPSRNLLAEDCVIWNERAGNGIRLGASMETSVFENITFRDIDVLHVNKGYAIMMDHSDWGHTRNVLFERLNNESDKPLMFLSTEETWFSNKTGYRNERGKISDLYFHQVTSRNPGVKLSGADAGHEIRNLWFADCTLGGKHLTSAEGFETNEHVSGLHFVDAMPERKIHPAEPSKGRELADLTIDNGDPGFWAFGGKGLQTLDGLAEAEGKNATRIEQLGWGHAAVYIPNLEGRYEVLVHWVAQPGLSSKTPWTVHHADGYKTTVLPSDTQTGWHSLGVHDLNATSWVRLVDPHYQITDGPVVADAVRFVRTQFAATHLSSGSLAASTGTSIHEQSGGTAGLRYYQPAPAVDPVTLDYEVAVYGGTSAGVTAAIQSARMGRKTILLSFNRFVGGLTSGGLTATDLGDQSSIGGMAHEFYKVVGFVDFSPSAAETYYLALLEKAGVTVLFNRCLKSVAMKDNHIVSATMETGETIAADMFIDATYEGDLLAAANVSYHVGREPTGTYNESLAGQWQKVSWAGVYQFCDLPVSPYVVKDDPTSGLLPEISTEPVGKPGQGDYRVQAYNFRMHLSNGPDRIPFPKPVGYDPARFGLLARFLQEPDVTWTLNYTTKPMKDGPVQMRNGDSNNAGSFSSDYVGGCHQWPDGTYQPVSFDTLPPPRRGLPVPLRDLYVLREGIFQDHVRYQQGLMYFLANDPQVPAKLRERVNALGLRPDEFVQTAHWPHQLYVREGRRMVSDYVMTQANCASTATVPDSVGLASYAMDSHFCQRVVVEIDGAMTVRNEGGFGHPCPKPYPISYRSIVPKQEECDNLLVPVSLSASHVTFGSIRMEPVFMILGQSAGTAAAFAIEDAVPVQKVNYTKLKTRLLADRQLL